MCSHYFSLKSRLTEGKLEEISKRRIIFILSGFIGYLHQISWIYLCKCVSNYTPYQTFFPYLTA